MAGVKKILLYREKSSGMISFTLLPARCAVPLSNGSFDLTDLSWFEKGSVTQGVAPPVLALLLKNISFLSW